MLSFKNFNKQVQKSLIFIPEIIRIYVWENPKCPDNKNFSIIRLIDFSESRDCIIYLRRKKKIRPFHRLPTERFVFFLKKKNYRLGVCIHVTLSLFYVVYPKKKNKEI